MIILKVLKADLSCPVSLLFSVSVQAQLIAQSIGQAFSVAYQEFLRANGINPEDLSQKEYSDIINTQEMYNDDLIHFSNSENCKEVSAYSALDCLRKALIYRSLVILQMFLFHLSESIKERAIRETALAWEMVKAFIDLHTYSKLDHHYFSQYYIIILLELTLAFTHLEKKLNLNWVIQIQTVI